MWIAQVEGKKYYLLNLSEEEQAAQAIARMLAYGVTEEKTYFPQGEFKSTENFEDFLKEIDAMPKESVKQIMGKHHYIPTPGTYQQQAKNYDNDIKLYNFKLY